MAERTTKERCIARLEGLKSVRQPYESEWKEIASLAQPARSRFLASQTNKAKRAANKRLMDDHGITSFGKMQNGLTAGLCSDTRPWFEARSPDDELMEDPEVKAYWAEVNRRMYSFIAPTNFYGSMKTMFGEVGLFGTAATVGLEHDKEGMVCHTLTAGEYWLAADTAMQAGALYRACGLTAYQAVKMFGKEGAGRFAVQAYDRSDYEQVIPYFHAIEENDEFEAGRLGWRGKPWRSIYWEEGCSDREKISLAQGTEEKPFWAPRWETTGYDVWGQGPGHTALPSLRSLQVQAKRKGEATDWNVKPEKVVASNVKLKNMPGAVTAVAGSSTELQKLVYVPHRVEYQTIAALREDIQDIRNVIDEITKASLFMAISNIDSSADRTVPEIDARLEEKMTQLGPVVQNMNNEALELAVERIFGIMQRGRLLPPAPDKLRNSPTVKITFVSTLTRLQRLSEIGGLERTFNMVGQASALYPQARHKFDFNEYIDRYAGAAGAAPEIIVPTEQANKVADAEQQAAENEKMAAAMASMAKPTKDITDAAAVAAELPGGGIPASQAILPPL